MDVTATLDATGPNCPPPVVRTKQATDSDAPTREALAASVAELEPRLDDEVTVGAGAATAITDMADAAVHLLV